MTKILLNLTAGTNVGLIRDNNEDNFTVCPDLSESNWIIPQDANADFPLGGLGSLTVVADGMGGMNAGEVASDIAVKTIQSLFTPDSIKAISLNDPEAIRSFMKQAIEEADRRIKNHSAINPETTGMGTTVVMSWIVGNMAHIAWCGDSRAYSYHPNSGLRQLSKDHSYVQELVDAGKLRPELAFDHPNSNIITSSLGDSEKPAAPDAVSTELHNGEIILLCSDGLCGMIRDSETEQIMVDNHQNLATCKLQLIEGALAAGGHDNVTVALTKVVKGCSSMPQIKRKPNGSTAVPNAQTSQPLAKKHSSFIPWLVTVFVMLAIVAGLLYFKPNSVIKSKNEVSKIDTIEGDTCTIYRFLDENGNIIRDSIVPKPKAATSQTVNEVNDKAKKNTRALDTNAVRKAVQRVNGKNSGDEQKEIKKIDSAKNASKGGRLKLNELSDKQPAGE